MEQKIARTGKIETRFTRAIGLVILSMLAALSVFTWIIVRGYSVQNAYEMAELAAQETNNRLKTMFLDLETTVRAFSKYDTVMNVERDAMLKIFFYTVLERKGYIRAIHLATKDGEMLQRGEGTGFTNGIAMLPEDYDPRQETWFETARDRGGYYLSDLYPLKTINALGMTASIPVLGKDQEFNGVLGIDITLDRLQNMIRDLKVPKGGKVMLVTLSGDTVVSQFDIKNAELTTSLKPSGIVEMPAILGEQNGTRIIHLDGKRYFAGYRLNNITRWISIIAIPYEEIMRNANQTLLILSLSFVVFLVLVLGVLVFQVRVTLKPLSSLTKAIISLTSGDLAVRSDIHRNDELGVLADNFNRMADSIEEQNRKISEQNERLEEKVRERTVELSEKNDQMMNDLRMAQRIQLAIIPRDGEMPRSDEVDFSAKYQAMENLGGDIYDIIKIGKNSIGFLMADVSGHGVPAALITTMIKVSFQSHTKPETSPGDILTAINVEMFKFIGDLEYYLSAYFCILDLDSGVLQYTNAGHHPAILQRENDRSLVRLDTKGYFIGSFLDGAYETKSVQLKPGDRLLLFTDGITEARNKEGEFYDYDRLTDYLRNHSKYSPREFVDGLARDVEDFSGDCPQNDDKAIMVIDFLGKLKEVGKAEDAMKVEARQIPARPESEYKAQYNEAVKAMKKGNYGHARVILENLIGGNSNDMRIANNLGVVYFRLNELDLAVKTLSDAIVRDPGNEGLRKNLEFVKSEMASGIIQPDFKV